MVQPFIELKTIFMCHNRFQATTLEIVVFVCPIALFKKESKPHGGGSECVACSMYHCEWLYVQVCIKYKK